MQFTARTQDGTQEITWSDGRLTGTSGLPEILINEALLREKFGPPVELPALHFITKNILKTPLGALGLIIEFMGRDQIEITGDIPTYHDDMPNDTIY